MATDLTLVIAIMIAITTSITAPLLLSHRMDRQHRQDRDADWARQDEVAARVAAHNTIADQTAADAAAQLQAIHTAVNSNLTARISETLAATQAQLAMMHRLIPEPDLEETATMSRLAATVAELVAQLADRHTAGGG